MTHTLSSMSPYFDPATSLSLLAPGRWEATKVGNERVQLLGEADAAHGDYRPTMIFTLLGTTDGTTEWLEETARLSLDAMKQAYEGFKLLGEDRFMLSCGAAVFARWYERTDSELGMDFMQLQGIIAGPAEAQFLASAAIMKPLASTVAPIFAAILSSVRVILVPA